jgi:hypothetical protein
LQNEVDEESGIRKVEQSNDLKGETVEQEVIDVKGENDEEVGNAKVKKVERSVDLKEEIVEQEVISMKEKKEEELGNAKVERSVGLKEEIVEQEVIDVKDEGEPVVQPQNHPVAVAQDEDSSPPERLFTVLARLNYYF